MCVPVADIAFDQVWKEFMLNAVQEIRLIVSPSSRVRMA